MNDLLTFKEYLREATLPDELSKDIFYHGTSISNVDDIFISGLKGREDQTKHYLAPIKNQVYMTKDFKLTMVYAAGASVLGSNWIPNDIETNPFGYIFVINNKDLKNKKVLPDEDFVGELIGDIFYNQNYYDQYKDKLYWLINLAKSKLTDNEIYKVRHGEYVYFAKVGKKLIKYMSDEQILQLLPYMKAISVSAPVKIKGCYVFDRKNISKLTGDLKKDKKYLTYVKNIQELKNFMDNNINIT
jgi:hypothetical protein